MEAPFIIQGWAQPIRKACSKANTLHVLELLKQKNSQRELHFALKHHLSFKDGRRESVFKSKT
jgi:hypothetical protein